MKCKKTQDNSRFTEVMHETVVSELKDELRRVTHNSQEEAHLEVDDMHEQIEDEFDIEAIEDCYEGDFIQMKEIAEELKKKAKDREEEEECKVELEREEEIEIEDSVCESDWDKSEVENEHEH